MRIKETDIQGLFLIENKVLNDNRGSFVKIFTEEKFSEYHLDCEFKEIFYTFSKKNTIRGMHFQNPPYDQEKLVTVLNGKILDVILDIRTSSPTYGKFKTFDLSSEAHQAIYIPKGCAHGYLALEDNCIVAYHTTSLYNQNADDGILYKSFGMEWKINNPILSEKDLKSPPFKDYVSKFQ